MHIVFVGAGGVGGYFGARLVAAGARVSFVARGRHAQAIADQGLRVTSPLGDVLVRPHAVAADPAALETADIVVFAVKLPNAQAAAVMIRPLVGPGTVVLPLQNGVDVADLLAAELGPEAVALGTAHIAVKIGAPGVIEHGGAFARLRFGAMHAGQAPALQKFLAACTVAGIDAEMVDDMRRASWEKFVLLVGVSSLTALTRLPVEATRKSPELRALLLSVMAETAVLARAEGINLPDDFVGRQMSFVNDMPATMKASMLHDLEAGRPLELPWLAGAVVRRSQRHGLATPACGFITAALSPYVHGAPAPVGAPD